MKHISCMTEVEMNGMIRAVENAAMEYATVKNFSGLSHNGWFNFYAALQDAIRSEWEKAKRKPAMRKPGVA